MISAGVFNRFSNGFKKITPMIVKTNETTIFLLLSFTFLHKLKYVTFLVVYDTNSNQDFK